MVRIKGNCEECGKRVAASKLIILAKTSKKMCLNCRKKELKKRNKACVPQINDSMGKSSQKIKSVTKIGKLRINTLSKDEITFLKDFKYKHNKFISGNDQCSAIINLKNKLNDCDNKIQKLKIKEKKDSEDKKELNKNFISGLK